MEKNTLLTFLGILLLKWKWLVEFDCSMIFWELYTEQTVFTEIVWCSSVACKNQSYISCMQLTSSYLIKICQNQLTYVTNSTKSESDLSFYKL